MTEDKMVGQYHQRDGDGFEQAPGGGDAQGSLACCSAWDRKESDMTEFLSCKYYIFVSLSLNYCHCP